MIKKIYVESVGSEIAVARRKGTRNLRLSIRSDGRIRLSIPYGVSERYAERFLNDKADWIKQHFRPAISLTDGMHIGKAHRLRFVKDSGDRIKTRIKQNEVIITIPANMNENSAEVQAKALATCEKALKKEAEKLLPQRLEHLSKKHDIDFASLKVKKLKSRWGSCDSHKNIILNTYLMQIDWGLIDYVILHELTHTIHQHHQADFWQSLGQICPDYKNLRKQIKAHPTNVFGTNF